jgi:hypothetical protein
MGDDGPMIRSMLAVLKHAIIVLDALGLRKLHAGQAPTLESGMATLAVGDAAVAYGYSEAKAKFRPTPREIAQAEVVDEWLRWLAAARGVAEVERLQRWALGTPMWLMAQRERCSERTVRNRLERSAAAILQMFGIGSNVETVEEFYEPMPYALAFSQPLTVNRENETVSAGRVWIDGLGFMRNGQRIRDGKHHADRYD